MNAPLVDRRLWLGAVQRLIDKVPAGEPLPLLAFAERLGLELCDVDATIDDLVAEGRLDKVTLRSIDFGETPAPPPVRKVVPARSLLPTGQQLHRQLVDEGKRRGLSARAVSLQVFGGQALLPMMKHGSQAVRPQTFEKAQAWLSLQVPDAPPIVTGAQLADEIEAWLEETGMARSRFGKMAMAGCPSGVSRLRAQSFAKPSTVARIRGFMANPPAEAFQRASPTRRNNSARGATPIGGRMVASNHGARVAAGIRKRATQQAEAILAGQDGGKGARLQTGKITSAVYGAMTQILERQAAEARRADPIEQAKLALRRRGRVVFAASVKGGPADRYLVGGMVDDAGKPKQLTDRELIEAAWRVNPQGMKELTGKGKE